MRELHVDRRDERSDVSGDLMSVVETNGKQTVLDGMAAIGMLDEYELIVIGGGPAGAVVFTQEV